MTDTLARIWGGSDLFLLMVGSVRMGMSTSSGCAWGVLCHALCCIIIHTRRMRKTLRPAATDV